MSIKPQSMTLEQAKEHAAHWALTREFSDNENTQAFGLLLDRIAELEGRIATLSPVVVRAVSASTCSGTAEPDDCVRCRAHRQWHALPETLADLGLTSSSTTKEN